MYKCELCIYESSRKANYNLHLKSKKHIYKFENCNNIVPINTNVIQINTNNIYNCEHCNSNYTKSSSLNRHRKTCVNQLLQNKDKELKQKDKQLEAKDSEIKELRHKNDELNNTIHQINNKQISVLQNNLKPSNTNNSQIIINNYPNAPNLGFPDNIPVDESLKEYIQLGGIKGLSKFISDYWVKDVKPIDRSIWMVDPSRNKFLIRCKDSWVIDIDGTQFQELNLEKIQNIFDDYITKYEFDAHDQIKTMEFINDIKTKNMIVKGLKDAGKYLVYDKERFTDFETIENETIPEPMPETMPETIPETIVD